MLKKDLADALGISGAMVSKLCKRGMPTHSIGAARSWRDEHLAFGHRKEHRMPSIRRQPLPAPEPAEQLPPAPDWRTLGDLFDLGLELLRDGHFELIAPRLRAALRSIHFAWRDAVEIRPEGNNDATETLAIPRPVWDALLADVLADVRRVDAEMVAAGEVLPPGERPPLTDDEADEMGAFWFCVAAGEVTTPDPAQGPADERQPAGAEPG